MPALVVTRTFSKRGENGGFNCIYRIAFRIRATAALSPWMISYPQSDTDRQLASSSKAIRC